MNLKIVFIAIGAILIAGGLVMEVVPSSPFDLDVFSSEDSVSTSSIEGSADFKTLEVRTEDVETITITPSGDSNEIVKVGGTEILPQKSIVIGNFTGRITFGEDVSIDGRSDEASIGDIVFKNPDIEISGLEKSEADFSDFVIGSFMMETLDGSLDLNGRISISIGNETVEVQGFDGNLKIGEDSVEINGTLRKLEVEGEYTLTFKD